MSIIDRRGVVVDATDPAVQADPNPGIAIKAPCLVATTAAIALEGLQTIDGVALASDNRVLVKDQADQRLNGIYAASSGIWQRTLDADGNDAWAAGTQVVATSGAVNANLVFQVTSADPIILGTTNLTFVSVPSFVSVQSFKGRSGAVSPASGDYTIAGNTIALPRSYLAGLGTSRNGVTPNTKIDVAAGQCRDDTDAFNIVFPTSKTIDCSTVGANGLDVGTLAINTWYFGYAIAKPDGTAAGVISTNKTTPTPMPTGYVSKRLIWAFKTDGSAHFLPYLQTGDLGEWNTPIEDLNTAALNTAAAVTLSVPPIAGVRARLQGLGKNASASVGIQIYRTTLAAVSGNGPTVWVSVANTFESYATEVTVDGSGQVNTSASASSSTLIIETLGWIFRRGRDD